MILSLIIIAIPSCFHFL